MKKKTEIPDRETIAAIALALRLHLGVMEHDIEPGVITIRRCETQWDSKALGFRIPPTR